MGKEVVRIRDELKGEKYEQNTLFEKNYKSKYPNVKLKYI